MASSKVMFKVYCLGRERQMKCPGRFVIIHSKRDRKMELSQLCWFWLSWLGIEWGFPPVSGHKENWWWDVLTKIYIHIYIHTHTHIYIFNGRLVEKSNHFIATSINFGCQWRNSHELAMVPQTSWLAFLGLGCFPCEMRLWTGRTDDSPALWVAGLLPIHHVMITEALNVRVSPLGSSLLSSWDAISPGSFPALIGHIVSTFFLSLSILDTVIPFVVFHNWLFPPKPAHNSLKATSPRCTNSPIKLYS